MTTITEGMTPAQFIIAMNSNFNAIKYSTTALTTISGSSNLSVIESNFGTVLGETTSPLSMDSIVGGLRGSVYASRINGNFNRYSSSDMTFTVGISKNYTSINEAITRAISENTIIIDAGSFDEKIDLTVKKLHLIGASNYGTTIDNLTDGLITTVDIATDSTFENIIFIKRIGAPNVYQEGVRPCVNVNGCNPIFTNCKISFPWSTENYSHPMTLDNGAVVTWEGGDIDSATALIAQVNYVTVKGGSTLNFTGGTFKACLNTFDTAIANIDVDYFWIADWYICYGLIANNNSVVNLKVNIREVFLDGATGEEGVETVWGGCHFAYDDAQVNVTGNEINGTFTVATGAGKLLFENVNNTYGRSYVVCCGIGAVVTYRNCNIVTGCNNTTEGWHIFEGSYSPGQIHGKSTLNIINSTLVFSGYNEPFQEWGCAIVTHENPEGMIINIENSIIIDEANQGKAGYEHSITLAGCDVIRIKDVESKILDFDGINEKFNITIAKYAGRPVNIIFDNIKFINSSNRNAIRFIDADRGSDVDVVFEEGDWIKVSGIINETQQTDICSDMANWNYLLANAPN